MPRAVAVVPAGDFPAGAFAATAFAAPALFFAGAFFATGFLAAAFFLAAFPDTVVPVPADSGAASFTAFLGALSSSAVFFGSGPLDGGRGVTGGAS
ncbi:hypothetical protein [Streptomyces sp. NPDC004783]|uniref:hypothetical protein n=1 Tax=Streptomyces sp. NPDC004783 TaxID=3154459 RepID=UPI0033AA3BB4